MNRSEAGKLGSLKSRDIQRLNYQNRIENYLKNPKLCGYCGGIISYKKRMNDYCSQSCAATHNNVLRGGVASELKICLNCDNKVSKGATLYCSRNCNKNHIWKIRCQLIESGQLILTLGVAKRFLSEKQKDCCKICGIKEWMNKPLVLVLDHINGNSDDFSIDNLRLICPNCDSQT